VFCQEDGRPLTDGLLKLPLRRALQRAGITREQGRIGWHDLRHTYGSHLAMRGIPLTVIKELMGHATIDMTERYAHLSPDTRREAVGVLDRPSKQVEAAGIEPAAYLRGARRAGDRAFEAGGGWPHRIPLGSSAPALILRRVSLPPIRAQWA